MIDLSKSVKKTDEEYFPILKPQTFPSFNELDELDITYKNAVIQSMTELSKKGAVFIGYNVKKGDAMGTLKDVPAEQK